MSENSQLPKKILDVPYVSQLSDQLDQNWQDRACGIACVTMCVDYYAARLDRHMFASSAPIQTMLEEGNIVIDDGVAKGIHGWNHGALTALLRNHGVPAYNEEFKSVHVNLAPEPLPRFMPSQYVELFLQEGIAKIIASIEAGNPVIISGIKHWTEKTKPHLFTFIGHNDEGFFYHDPFVENKIEGKHEPYFISKEDFKIKWRRMAIFCY